LFTLFDQLGRDLAIRRRLPGVGTLYTEKGGTQVEEKQRLG
jgi:hypothetical protein